MENSNRMAGKNPGRQRGSVVLVIIMLMIIVGGLAGALTRMSSTSVLYGVAANTAMRAGYLAESGLRYLSSQYIHGGSLVEKLTALKQASDKTYTLPGNDGTFSLAVHPYFLQAVAANVGDTTLRATVPGTLPATYPMAVGATAAIRLGSLIYNVTVSSINTTSATFLVSGGLKEAISDGMPITLAMAPTVAQTVNSGGTLNVKTDYRLLPEFNGRIEVGVNSPPSILRYEHAENKGNGIVTLTDVTAVTTGALPVSVETDSWVVLKKHIILDSTGTVGTGDNQGKRTISYSIPITDDEVNSGLAANESLFQETFATLDSWDVPSGKVTKDLSILANRGEHKQWATMGNMQGGDAVTDPENPAESLKSVVMLLKKNTLMKDAWTRQSKLLSYDVQFKQGWGYNLRYAADGVNVRWNKVTGSLYEGLCISFMKFNKNANDYIPNSICPYWGDATKSLSGKPLIVLWEQRVVEGKIQRKWIAYRDLSIPNPDNYALGEQWQYDGTAFNDLTSLFVRVEEKRVEGIKVNDIKLFYADAAAGATRAAIAGDFNPTNTVRLVYPPTWDANTPMPVKWPKTFVFLWTPLSDYMTLVTQQGKGTNNSGTLITWDGINPAVQGYGLLADKWTVRTRQFTTSDTAYPDSSPEIALHTFGDITNGQGNYSNKFVSFDDVAIQLLGALSPNMYSTFAPSVQQ